MAAVEPLKPAATSGAVVEPQSAAQHWQEVADTPEFRRLITARKRFVIPATIFFLVYYFALPISVGYFPDVMSTRVVGNINLAYLFALSQFVMAWVLAGLYVHQATNVFDPLARAVLQRVRGGRN